mgnify:CR=1 FL=1
MDKVYYYNRDGILKLTFGESPYFIDSTDLKNWIWSYDSQFNRYRNFRRGKEGFQFAVVLLTRNKTDRDALCEIFDDDVIAGKPGYLMCRGWKLPCFITEAEHGYYREEIEWRVVFNAISETSTWVRETTTTYMSIASEELVDLGRDYSLEENDTAPGRGYAIDSDETASTLIDSFGAELADAANDVFVTFGGTFGVPGYGYSVIANYSQMIVLPADGNGFKVTFLGPCTDPEIYLDGKPVRVYTSILSGEKLEITSNGREKTIYKISAQGVKTSAFVYRDKENSPFFAIGKSTELTYGDISFDFTTIEQRSEPAWI